MLHSAPVGVLIQDQAGKVSWVNETLTRLLDLPGEQIMGQEVSKLPLERTDIETDQGAVYYLSPAAAAVRRNGWPDWSNRRTPGMGRHSASTWTSPKVSALGFRWTGFARLCSVSCRRMIGPGYLTGVPC